MSGDRDRQRPSRPATPPMRRAWARGDRAADGRPRAPRRGGAHAARLRRAIWSSSREWASAQGLAPGAGRPEATCAATSRTCRERGAAPSTSARKLAALRALFREPARARARSRENPADLVSTPAARRRSCRACSARARRRRCSTASPPAAPLELRDRAMFELAYACGLRAEELVSLSVDDVDYDGEQLRVEGKGRKTRFVPVGEPAMAALRDYLERARRALAAGRARTRLDGAAAGGAVPVEDRPPAGHERRPPPPAHVDDARAAVASAAAARLAARAAPQLRHASARRRRRSAQHPGAARPRQRVQHPDLHSGRVREA